MVYFQEKEQFSNLSPVDRSFDRLISLSLPVKFEF